MMRIVQETLTICVIISIFNAIFIIPNKYSLLYFFISIICENFKGSIVICRHNYCEQFYSKSKVRIPDELVHPAIAAAREAARQDSPRMMCGGWQIRRRCLNRRSRRFSMRLGEMLGTGKKDEA